MDCSKGMRNVHTYCIIKKKIIIKKQYYFTLRCQGSIATNWDAPTKGNKCFATPSRSQRDRVPYNGLWD